MALKKDKAVGVRLFVAVSALAALLTSTSAHAYTFVSRDGCPEGRGASWEGGITPWQFNVRDAPELDLDEIEAAFRKSFDVWDAPCCASFQNQYKGRTDIDWKRRSATAYVAFLPHWPPEFGQWSIGVTLPQIEIDCRIVSGNLYFNSKDFEFSLDGEELSNRRVDLQTIAVHEFGHLIGLGHSAEASALMYAVTGPGSINRELGEDDEAGICALYPGWCEGCVDSDACPGALSCIGGSCVFPTCERTEDCAAGTICFQAACVPGCRTNLDCAEGSSCIGGSCEEPIDCTICDDCEALDECGTGSLPYHCVPWGAGMLEGRCSKNCESDADCDGDSVCGVFAVGSAQYRGCVAPRSTPADFCPADYLCERDLAKEGCVHSLWERCPTKGGGCGGHSDVCVSAEDGARCSCTCRGDAECGPEARCLEDPASGLPTCFPERVITPCGASHCFNPEICREGSCVDPCDGVSCGEAERCERGSCVSICGSCPEGQRCDGEAGRCLPVDPCSGVSCDPGERCEEGSCVPDGSCGGLECAEGERCVEESCQKIVKKTKEPSSGCGAADSASVPSIVSLAAFLTLYAARRMRSCG